MNIFKGVAQADMDHYTSGKLDMIRLRISFMGDLSKYIPVDGLASKNVIESLDIELFLIEYFFKKKMSRNEIVRMLSPVHEMYKVKQIGQFLGSITIDYETFTALVTYLQYLSFETFKSGDVL